MDPSDKQLETSLIFEDENSEIIHLSDGMAETTCLLI